MLTTSNINIQFLYRPELVSCKNELSFLKSFKNSITSFNEISKNSIVFPRYCYLPHSKWVESEIILSKAQPINSLEIHKWIANMDWYEPIQDLTPKTWRNWHNLPEKSFVLKGLTNSKKFQWNNLMFAKTKKDVPLIAKKLLDDSLISEQGIVVREFIDFKNFGHLINGLPITNEWRFFVLNSKIIDYSFYWQFDDINDDLIKKDLIDKKIDPKAFELIEKVICLIEDYFKKKYENYNFPFCSIDVAEDKSGKWWVIEINDGMQSGLSNIEPCDFYTKILSQY